MREYDRGVYGGLGERPVFSVGERVLRWDDVVGWAGRSGALAGLERETALALAALERDGPPDAAAVRAAGAAFRYARGLLAADELEAWLARWELTTDDWLAHLRRTVASGASKWLGATSSRGRERSGRPGRRDLLGCAHTLGRRARGAPRRRARRGRRRARGALRRASAGTRSPTRRSRGRSTAAASTGCASRPSSSRFPTRTLRARWRSARARTATRSTSSPGAPAPSCSTLDAYLDDVVPELAAALLGAQEGEILGPLAVDGRFVVALAHRKTTPRAGDPALRERAAALLLARALEREVESRVSWHDRA